jgi:DNA-binding LacI/PurR family transcriptional regulator
MKRKPVSLADLAKLMKATPATVSRALRNEDCISLATRQRAAELAAQLGYQPDPEVTRLMAHIRSRRETRFQSVLALLSDSYMDDAVSEDPYTQRVITGVVAEAGAWGEGGTDWQASGPGEQSAGAFLRSRGWGAAK